MSTDRSWKDENRLQRKVLFAVFQGEEVDPAAVRDWRRVRAEIERALIEGGRERVEAVLAERISLLEERLVNLEDGEFSLTEEPDRNTRFLHCLEALLVSEKLRWIRRIVGCDLNDSRRPFNPAFLLKAEIFWVRAQAQNLAGGGRNLTEVADRLAAEAWDIRNQLKVVSIDGWLGNRDVGDGHDVLPDSRPGSDSPVGDAALEIDDPIDGSAADDPAIDDERLSSGDSVSAAASSPEFRRFRAAWRRSLDYHEIVSDIDTNEPRFASRLDSLRSSHEADLAECRSLLAATDGALREECLLEAVLSLEEMVSGFISEGDLLEIPDRIVKLRAVVTAVDEFKDTIRGLKGKRRTWFLSAGTRLKFGKGFRRVLWSRYYGVKMARSLRVDERLEQTFGRLNVRRFENLIFLLIFLLLALVGVEWYLENDWQRIHGDSPHPWATYFQIADLLICSVLLTDFFVRWAFGKWSFWFFRQHFVFDFLPALPYGFIAGQLTSLPVHSELPHFMLAIRVGRALRGAAPFLRLFRLLVFLVRGLDRAVQRFRGFLDRHILFFEPEPEYEEFEDPLVRLAEKQAVRGIALVRDLFRDIGRHERPVVLEGYCRLLENEVSTLEPQDFTDVELRPDSQDVQLESVIDRLVACDVLTVGRVLGRNSAKQIARFLRWIDVPVIRSVPGIRRLVPASRRFDPLEAVAEAGREIGEFLQRFLSVFNVWGDLSGITTGPQILDRVSTAMVRATQRPAVRLLLFGSLFLIGQVLFAGLQLELLGNVTQKFWDLLGLPMVILGSICLLVNFTGRWFKRIAGEALDVYLRTSRAHFFSLLKEIKVHRMERDLEEIVERVIAPECRMRYGSVEEEREAHAVLRSKLAIYERVSFADGMDGMDGMDGIDSAETAPSHGGGLDREVDRELDQIVLLYRDYLDSTPLERTDDQTSVQLLGNMAVRDIRMGTLGHGKKELRRLERLALRKERMLGSGPYLWFRFISESLAIETAKLVIEYNSSCIPLRRLDSASGESRRRCEEFLESKRKSIDPASRRALRSRAAVVGQSMLTTEFHALHFLKADPDRDERIGEIFGEEVQAAMVRDRRAMVRDIFGTWPYHRLPRSVRRVNLYRVYFRYFRGVRIYLLPLLLIGRLLELVFLALAQFARVVREVLGKAQVERSRLQRVAGFDVAKRKINRMRKPYFMEAMRLRAAVEVEDLGLRVPGMPVDSTDRTFRDDLEFIGALERERRPFEDLRRQAIRDLRRLRQFLAERGWLGADFKECLRILEAKGVSHDEYGLALRAVVTAFITDRHGLRSRITGPLELQQFFDDVLRGPPRGFLWRFSRRLFYSVCLVWPGYRRRRRLFEAYWNQRQTTAPYDATRREELRYAFLAAEPAIHEYCQIAIERDMSGSNSDAIVLDALRNIVSEHALWSRKLLALRMIQTITILDVRSYRDLIWSLGGFEVEGRPRASDTFVRRPTGDPKSLEGIATRGFES